MYAVSRDLHPPTGVEHCIECHFFNLKKTSLVVASASLLRVYDISGPADETEGKKKLVQVGEYNLYGNVESLGKVRLLNAERDSILLSFRQAKLSVIEYNPETNCIKTVSLHSFEEDEVKGARLHSFQRPYLRTEPEGKCAAMFVYGTHLAVLPFRQTNILEDHAQGHSSFLDDPHPTTPLSASLPVIGPSYLVELASLSERVLHVRDFVFLHGYNYPTVFLLYEPTPTWAGRLSLRRDTCCVVAVSLNLASQCSTVIWHSPSLASDSAYCVPVPRPIGGVLVVGANLLVYMKQSSATLGFCLNAKTDTSSSQMVFKHPPGLVVTMDGSQAVFLSGDHLMVALRGGDIFSLTLIPDGVRGLRNILFEKTASGVLPSCIDSVGEEHVFLGSRLGNSLLLGYNRKALSEGSEEPAMKKPKTADEADELQQYRIFQPSGGHSLSSFKLDVCDSILNIAPVSDITIAQPAFRSEEMVEYVMKFDSSEEMDLELVACSGHGKNGSLTVLQREVRPQVVTTFELPGCSDMWTVYSRSDNEEGGVIDEYHTYLILSQSERTMVLRTGQEITELDVSGFATQVPTVMAGNMAGNRYIVQVTTADVRLLSGTEQLCRVPLDMGGGVKSCDITYPYILILLVDGTVALLWLEEVGGVASLQFTWPELVKGARVSVVSAYTDTTHLFLTSVANEDGEAKKEVQLGGVVKVKDTSETSMDEEDALLYGGQEDTGRRGSSSKTPEGPPSAADPSHVGVANADGSQTNWFVLGREDGSLEVYQLKGERCGLVFSVRNFSAVPHTLKDSGPVASDHQQSSDATINEVLIVGLGPAHQMTPYLFALVDNDLVVYEGFHYHDNVHPGHLHLRFSKVHHNVILTRGMTKAVKLLNQQSKEQPESEVGGQRFVAKLRVFRRVGGYSGVFVCGTYPHWVMGTQRGVLRFHPMFVDGPSISFTSFHNINCPHGFLYFNALGELRICVLPSHLSYDAHWPTRKVPVHCTPHFVSYHLKGKVHAVVLSQQVPLTHLPTGDGPEDIQKLEREDNFILPVEDKYHMELYSPEFWQAVPNTRVDMDRFEHVVAMNVLALRSQETMSGRKEFIVIGSTSVCGEDIQCKGKIRIYDVIEVIPEPGKPITKHKLKNLYCGEQKGTISALEAVDGLLMACMAQKIYMWNFKDNKDLVGVAFIDGETYIHRAIALKTFVIVADVSRSIQVLRYKEHLRNLSLVSKDQFPAEIYSSDFIIDGQQLGFIASDSDKNLILYQYQPEMPESHGGQFLVRRGDFNAGSHINTFFRLHCRSRAPLGSSPEVKALLKEEKRHTTYYATLDGGIGYVLPVQEKVYRRMLMLQMKMNSGLPHWAGLNPKAFRLFQTRHQYLYNPQKNILDGNLLARYSQLSLKEKLDFAKQIGTSPRQVLDNLKDMDMITAHF